MREKTIMRVKTVRADDPTEFDRALNGLFLDIDASDIDRIVQLSELTATVYYKVTVAEEVTTMDLYKERFGHCLTCGCCQWFEEPADKRSKKGMCSMKNLIKRIDSIGCEEAMKEALENV